MLLFSGGYFLQKAVLQQTSAVPRTPSSAQLHKPTYCKHHPWEAIVQIHAIPQPSSLTLYSETRSCKTTSISVQGTTIKICKPSPSTLWSNIPGNDTNTSQHISLSTLHCTFTCEHLSYCTCCTCHHLSSTCSTCQHLPYSHTCTC